MPYSNDIMEISNVSGVPVSVIVAVIWEELKYNDDIKDPTDVFFDFNRFQNLEIGIRPFVKEKWSFLPMSPGSFGRLTQNVVNVAATAWYLSELYRYHGPNWNETIKKYFTTIKNEPDGSNSGTTASENVDKLASGERID